MCLCGSKKRSADCPIAILFKKGKPGTYLVRNCSIPIISRCCLFKQHHITAKIFLLLLVYLYRFHHMKLGDLGYIRVRNDIAIYITPSFLLVNNLFFIPVIHSYFIKTGRIIADKNELV